MVKLVDTMDSKSIAFTGVAVRVRPLVPLKRLNTSKTFIISIGNYQDVLIKDNGEWLFKERVYHFDGEIDPSLSDAMKELFKDKPSGK